MGLISTPFLTYREISAADCDILEDAFGLKGEFEDVYTFLGSYKVEPGDDVIEHLLARVSERKQKSATG